MWPSSSLDCMPAAGASAITVGSAPSAMACCSVSTPLIGSCSSVLFDARGLFRSKTLVSYYPNPL